MTENKEFKFHEYSSLFPNLEGDEFEALVEDIKEHGQLEPIILYNNEILDGKNRYRACEKLGKKPIFRKYSNGIKAIDYVVSENIKRRHLDKGQIALILDEVVKIRVAEREREIEDAKKKAEEEAKRLKTLEEKKRKELEAKKQRELEKAKTEAEKKKIAEKIEKEKKAEISKLNLEKKSKTQIPKKTSYDKEAIKIGKESKITPQYIHRAKKLKEMAETDPEVKKKVEEVQKGKKSLERAYTEAKQPEDIRKALEEDKISIKEAKEIAEFPKIEQRKIVIDQIKKKKDIADKIIKEEKEVAQKKKPMPIIKKENIDKKKIDKMQNIFFQVTQEYHIEDILEYGIKTQEKCVEIMRKAYQFIFKELEKYGKRSV